MFGLEEHREFLSKYFGLPDPDRTEPYEAAGIRGAKSLKEGFPDAALTDRLFTSLSRLSWQTPHVGLMDAYLEMGIPVGWLSDQKKPLNWLERCGYKQGFCLDRELLLKTYGEKRFSSAPPAFLGFHTNLNASAFVIDLDFKAGVKDAVITFFSFLEKNGVNPGGLPCVMTPSGGVHLYFLPHSGPHASTSNLAPEVWGQGVDPRGTGALVLAPGSFFSRNLEDRSLFKQYMVLNNVPLPPLPACVADVLERHAKKNGGPIVPVGEDISFDGDSEIDAACRILATKTEGERNCCLNAMSYAAGKMIRDGRVKEDEARVKLMAAAKKTGLDDDEIARTVDSGIGAGLASRDPYVPFNNNVNGTAETAETAKETETPKEEASMDDDRLPLKSFLAQFAERDGDLTEKRVDAIAQKVFPEEIYQSLKLFSGQSGIDMASLSQAMVSIACQTVKGSRRLHLGGRKGQTMPANLFTLAIGGPASGKSTLANFFMGIIKIRQSEEHAKYMEAYEIYLEKKAIYDRAKNKDDVEKPEKPVFTCFYLNDGTMEGVIARAYENPEGLFWHIDEGAGQSNMGGGRYNKNSEADVRAKLISGFSGDTITVERKNHENSPQSMCIRNFNLSLWLNVQDRKIPQTFCQGDEDQGYIQRFSFIILPPRPEGERGCQINAEDSADDACFDFLDETLEKLLGMRIYPDEKGARIPQYLYFKSEAVEVFDKWHRAITKKCRYGAMLPYIERFIEQVYRFALGLHYLHLAARCARMGITVAEAEREPQSIEVADVERAIAVADIFLKKLDEFLRLWKAPAHVQEGKRSLTREEEAFAKHVLANAAFYMEPRSAREIIERGYLTSKTPQDLRAWLKAEGFEASTPRTGSGKRSHREAKFMINGLYPWQAALDLGRLAFNANAATPLARTIFECRELIEASDYRMGIPEFAENLGADAADGSSMVKALTQDRRFMVDEYDGELLFRKETFGIVERLLSEEGLLTDGKLLAC